LPQLEANKLDGSSYADTLIGSLQNDVISGGDGNDLIRGEAGDDILLPDFGDDTVDGGAGNDLLIVDYSDLPTRAVAWRDYNSTTRLWDVFVANAYGIGTPIKISVDEGSTGYSGNVTLSANGTKLAWVDTSPNGTYRLWIKTLEGIDGSGSLVTINLPEGFSLYPVTPSLSADGNKVAFIGQSTTVNSREIFVANTDGSGIARITNNNSFNYEVVISGDGSKVAWSDANREIFVANTDGTGVRRITDDSNLSNHRMDIHPSISGDGSKVAWTSFGSVGFGEIFVASTDGTGIKQLTSTHSDYPSLSADGTKVAYWNDSHIYVSNTDGSRKVVVADSKLANGRPSLALDGEKVAFDKWTQIVDGQGTNGSFVANADGTGTPIPIKIGKSFFGSEPQQAAKFRIQAVLIY
jgi:Tol biopolymer transport system component